ncbi:MAG: hypothetical protein DRG78_02750 [Epsilonproteobacteria bacterium]|nr:MAG: hypothetical protein DRG78_02750 [Campylobacterota bacterium]
MPIETKQFKEDEIDLIELWNRIIKRKIFIFLFTVAITILAVIYVLFKNTNANVIPVYTGSVMIEIGEVKTTNLMYLDNIYNLKHIVEKKYSVNISIPKRATKILIIKSTNKSKELIEANILDSINFIIKRHKERASLFDKYIMTKQVGEISINKQPINTINKKRILIMSSIMGFIASIFLALFLGFLEKIKLNKKIEE